ncbi:hypothetical protein EIN_328570 [Entamoeba invadens IP1]|uniref:TLDc domain-containing protein n=1 Tax=Entamoeba invadens IP1 TaxID=370355 RepID=A0A0A1TXS1_ENTIV|nr:hypothetical protein EIN_328570 [Entamoeba invadens IP1]ELP86170.1 hypothetical protein EIN_328570 [Entamoeba invadens IP1]|eukprot:XP_004185516.1 hypothetical protein EIN_328570 [Entamoeba invadens IP1]
MKAAQDQIFALSESLKGIYGEFHAQLQTVTFEDDTTKNIVERIKNAENAFDKLDSNFQKGIVLGKEAQALLKRTLLFVNNIKQSFQYLDSMNEKTNNIIKTLNNLYIEEFKLQKNTLENNFQMEVTKCEEIKNKKISELLKIQKENKYSQKEAVFDFETKEVEKLEEIAQQKISNVLFDSITDDWSKNTSVFGDKINNKTNVLFLVEDDQNNKFGGVLYDEINIDTWIDTKTSFIFSLVRNGILNPIKFDLQFGQNRAFIVSVKDNHWLFVFGKNEARDTRDICIKKKGISGNKCSPTCYNAKIGDLNDGNEFIPKRIRVFQLSDSL